MQQIHYDPGIFGFVKAHRHHSGAALVMTSNSDVIDIYWTKRLHHASKRVHPHVFPVINDKSIAAAERCYEWLLEHDPPSAAQCDYQRDRVYSWENDHICPGHRKLTWTGCQRFVQQVWQQVGSGPLELTSDRRYLDAISLDGLIHLPVKDRYGEERYFWRKPIILHEIGHELTKGNQHGAWFVSTYIDLCVRFLGYDREFLIMTAREYDIDFY